MHLLQNSKIQGGQFGALRFTVCYVRSDEPGACCLKPNLKIRTFMPALEFEPTISGVKEQQPIHSAIVPKYRYDAKQKQNIISPKT